jgi:hypothetical protein
LLAAFGCYVVGGLLSALDQASWIIACALASGLVLHLFEVVVLLADGAVTARGWSQYHRIFKETPPAKKKRTLARALVSPSRARWLTLNLRAFQGRQVFELNRAKERLYFNVMNLELGQQAVIGANGIHHLDENQLEIQNTWRRRWYSGWRLSEDTLLATAVAASSAFPPLFRPVPIEAQHDSRGATTFHLSDGGTADNTGFKLARSLLIGSRQTKEKFGIPSFEDATAIVLTLDASKPVQPAHHVSSRLRALRRLILATQSAQTIELFAAQDWFSEVGLQAAVCGLRVGYITEGMDDFGEVLPRVRTHLDAFTIGEVGAIAYCGYQHVDHVIQGGLFQRAGLGDARPASLASLKEYLASLGECDLSTDDLRRTLGRSMRIVSARRWLRARRDRRTHSAAGSNVIP